MESSFNQERFAFVLHLGGLIKLHDQARIHNPADETKLVTRQTKAHSGLGRLLQKTG